MSWINGIGDPEYFVLNILIALTVHNIWVKWLQYKYRKWDFYWSQMATDGIVLDYKIICHIEIISSPCYVVTLKFGTYKNIERHTAHTIVTWPTPKQWVIVHTSDLMMIIRQIMYILSIITNEMGKLKTHSPTYCIMDNWENMLNLTHTLDKSYLTGIL